MDQFKPDQYKNINDLIDFKDKFALRVHEQIMSDFLLKKRNFDDDDFKHIDNKIKEKVGDLLLTQDEIENKELLQHIEDRIIEDVIHDFDDYSENKEENQQDIQSQKPIDRILSQKEVDDLLKGITPEEVDGEKEIDENNERNKPENNRLLDEGEIKELAFKLIKDRNIDSAEKRIIEKRLVELLKSGNITTDVLKNFDGTLLCNDIDIVDFVISEIEKEKTTKEKRPLSSRVREIFHEDIFEKVVKNLKEAQGLELNGEDLEYINRIIEQILADLKVSADEKWEDKTDEITQIVLSNYKEYLLNKVDDTAKPPFGENKEYVDPSNEAEKETVEMIEGMDKKEKKTFLEGLANIGYGTTQLKSSLLKKFCKVLSKKTAGSELVSSFFDNYADIYKKAGEKAKKERETTGKGVIKKGSGIGQGIGNVIKYGRIIADFAQTGSSRLLNPFRHITAASMFVGRTSEAVKETRLDYEKVKESTRVKDEDRAWDEAYLLYNQVKDEKGGVSADELNKKYRENLPKDIIGRLERANFSGTKFFGKILDNDANKYAERIIKKINKINNDEKLTPEKKNEKIQAYINKNESLLMDLDRIVSDQAGVDTIAYISRIAEGTGKGVANVMMIDSIYRLAKNAAEISTWFSGGTKVTGLKNVANIAPGTESSSLKVPDIKHSDQSTVSHYGGIHGKAPEQVSISEGIKLTQEISPKEGVLVDGTVDGNLKNKLSEIFNKLSSANPEEKKLPFILHGDGTIKRIGYNGNYKLEANGDLLYKDIDGYKADILKAGSTKWEAISSDSVHIEIPQEKISADDFASAQNRIIESLSTKGKISLDPDNNIKIEGIDGQFEVLPDKNILWKGINQPMILNSSGKWEKIFDNEILEKKFNIKIINGHGAGQASTSVETPSIEQTAPNVPSPKQFDQATVGHHEGIEHAFKRQLVSHAKELGYEGDVSDKIALRKWTEGEAHRIAIKAGYVNQENGEWVGVRSEDKIAYVLEKDSSGNIKVSEYLKGDDGKFASQETHELSQDYKSAEFEKDLNDYEYKGHNKVIEHEAIAEKEPESPREAEAPVEAPVEKAAEVKMPEEIIYKLDENSWLNKFDHDHDGILNKDEIEYANKEINFEIDKYKEIENDLANIWASDDTAQNHMVAQHSGEIETIENLKAQRGLLSESIAKIKAAQEAQVNAEHLSEASATAEPEIPAENAERFSNISDLELKSDLTNIFPQPKNLENIPDFINKYNVDIGKKYSIFTIANDKEYMFGFSRGVDNYRLHIMENGKIYVNKLSASSDIATEGWHDKAPVDFNEKNLKEALKYINDAEVSDSAVADTGLAENVLELKEGMKLSHVIRGTSDATIAEIKNDGTISLKTDDNVMLELRPTNDKNIYEYDVKGSGTELADGAVDISNNKLNYLYDYLKIEREIKGFSKFLDPELQNKINTTDSASWDYEFFKEVREAIENINRLEIVGDNNYGKATITLIDNGEKVTKTFDIPQGCEISESHSDYPGNDSVEISGPNGTRYSGSLILDKEKNILIDSFGKPEKLEDVINFLKTKAKTVEINSSVENVDMAEEVAKEEKGK